MVSTSLIRAPARSLLPVSRTQRGSRIMARMGTEVGQVGAPRVDWVDYAKGFCIVMVVMMHSTLGVEAAAGQESWMHALVAFAKPFRMPDFFMISGLFLARRIDRGWRSYLDRKVVQRQSYRALARAPAP